MSRHTLRGYRERDRLADAVAVLVAEPVASASWSGEELPTRDADPGSRSLDTVAFEVAKSSRCAAAPAGRGADASLPVAGGGGWRLKAAHEGGRL